MPIGIGTAIAGGAAILGAGATIYASSKASHAQTKAANQAAQTEQNVATQNNDFAKQIYAENAARLDPYSNMGLAAGDAYMGLLLGSAPTTTGSPNGWATVHPANALATAVPSTPAPVPSALGTGNIAEQAQAALAAGADPAAVRARIEALGGTAGPFSGKVYQ